MKAFLKTVEADGTILIPAYMFELDSRMPVGFQKVTPSGVKQFTPGMSMQGACCPVGSPDLADDLVFITETYDMACCVHTTLQSEVGGYAAFSSSNLVHVAQMARARHPSAHILIAAESDEWGMKAALAAMKDIDNATLLCRRWECLDKASADLIAALTTPPFHDRGTRGQTTGIA